MFTFLPGCDKDTQRVTSDDEFIVPSFPSGRGLTVDDFTHTFSRRLTPICGEMKVRFVLCPPPDFAFATIVTAEPSSCHHRLILRPNETRNAPWHSYQTVTV